MEKMVQCEECAGEGLIDVECEECDGEGMTTELCGECGQDIEESCEDCVDGMIEETCESCEGDGEVLADDESEGGGE